MYSLSKKSFHRRKNEKFVLIYGHKVSLVFLIATHITITTVEVCIVYDSVKKFSAYWMGIIKK